MAVRFLTRADALAKCTVNSGQLESMIHGPIDTAITVKNRMMRRWRGDD
jgi:hypothetical protein